MNRNSSEVLPGEYRQTRTIDFVNFSAENVIGLLLTLVLLVGPVLLVLPKHPFNLLFSAKNALFSLIYCLVEDALICDFAETYHIFDWRALPVRLAATLAAGLPETSRIRMKMAGAKMTASLLMQAAMVDRLSLLVWMQTKEGKKNRHRPQNNHTCVWYCDTDYFNKRITEDKRKGSSSGNITDKRRFTYKCRRIR